MDAVFEMRNGVGSNHQVNGRAKPPEDRLQRAKKDLHERLVRSIDMSALARMSTDEVRVEIRRGVEELSRGGTDLLTTTDRERVVTEILNDTFGYGPLEALLGDSTISDILINGPKQVYVERRGRLELTDITFTDEKHLLNIVQRICSRVNRRVDESSPMVDARLPDGSRVNAIIPPLSMKGTVVSIRRFGAKPLQAADLIAGKSATSEMLDFLGACVKGRLNMVVSGGTGSGKTTLLNMLSSHIPHSERVCTIEDTAELQLQQPHVVPLETRQANIEGSGEVTQRGLLKNALRMRPDRIVMGECRGEEAFDMLQAMNTGHEGSLTTVHANDTREAVSRLEMMVGMANFDLPIWIIRRQIVSAISIIVQTARLRGGPRKIVRISEITGMEGETISMQDLFVFKQTGVDHNEVAQGHFEGCGIRPKCLDKLASMGIKLPQQMFDRRTL